VSVGLPHFDDAVVDAFAVAIDQAPLDGDTLAAH
jgi:hypothetical protein